MNFLRAAEKPAVGRLDHLEVDSYLKGDTWALVMNLYGLRLKLNGSATDRKEATEHRNKISFIYFYLVIYTTHGEEV